MTNRVVLSDPFPVHWAVGGLLALVVFSSAYLVFQVQPLMSKFVLPWFGGSPSVWTTAMLFFQCLLFGGYAYAHLVARFLSIRQQTLAHIGLLVVAAVLAASIVPGEHLKPQGLESPVWSILLLLGSCVGLPYFCLSTTGPLIQHWFAHAYPGRSPYRLYSLSNLGSLLALLSFPYVFEPLLELQDIARYWSVGFAVFSVLCVIAAVQIRRVPGLPAGAGVAHAATGEPAAAPGMLQRLAWVGLPALASLAFIATTDRVSHDIAPEPRLWIATLSLYLLTFIICFDHERWYRRRVVAGLCLAAILLLTASRDLPEMFGLEWDISATEVRWSHFFTMFLICLMCHGELVRAKPKSHKYLTEFYLWMSFGGACGGLFVALVATNCFNEYYEWPLCLVAAIGVGIGILASASADGVPKRGREGGAISRQLAYGAGGLMLVGGVLFLLDPLQWRQHPSSEFTDAYLQRSRNFYGTVAVKERIYPADPAQNYRVFYSGQITHGVQFTLADKRTLPISYYAPESGVGETLDYAKAKHPSIDVGIIGLGIGTLANYARPADRYDLYEINPQVVGVANTLFDNVANSRAGVKNVIVGDARLKLEQTADAVKYDVLVLDAFSGGSVPIHLLTREAFAIYQRHLKPDGFIAINITNGYLNLYPVVKRQAEHLGLGIRYKFQGSDGERKVRKSYYAILTRDADYLARYPSAYRRHVDDAGRLPREEDPNIPDVPLWTDSFSSINPIEIRD
jgi:hypothetical protein